MQSKYLTIKNNNLDIGIEGFTLVYFSLPSTIMIKAQHFTFVSIEALGFSSNKSGNTLARGILGGVVLDTVGAIGGLIVGNNNETGLDVYIYKVNLTGGKYFVFTSSTPDIDFHLLTPDNALPFIGSIENTTNNEFQYDGLERLRESALRYHNLSHEQLVQLMGNIEQQVKKIITNQLDDLELNEDDIKSESSFVDDLGADELDTIEIMMALEEYLGCEIPYEDCKKITTLQSAIDYVNVFVHGTSKPPQTNISEPLMSKFLY